MSENYEYEEDEDFIDEYYSDEDVADDGEIETYEYFCHPVNRYVSLQKADLDTLLESTEHVKKNEKEKLSVFLPDSYHEKKEKIRHQVYHILKVSDKCEQFTQLDENKLALVDESMVEKIDVPFGSFLLVQENYIYALINEVSYCSGLD